MVKRNVEVETVHAFSIVVWIDIYMCKLILSSYEEIAQIAQKEGNVPLYLKRSLYDFFFLENIGTNI